jgi:hypothetical protein|tara:strand:+ start:261 stop:731 length:471 start_codon:yes stop_codon:yes gene_type:complete
MGFKPRSYQNKGNWKKGEISEKRFKDYMDKIGIGATKTPTHIDKNYHIDFIIGEITPVDLKGDKNTDAVWLEKRNVWGGKGSLYGFAKYMVIEYLDIKSYVFYDRLGLVRYIKRFQEVCINKSDYHCLYTRDGNKDVIIKVRESDIRDYERYRFQY